MCRFAIPGKKNLLQLPGICAVLALMLALVLSTAQASSAQLSLTLAWQPGTGPIAGYKVYYGVSSGKYTNSVDVPNANGLSCTLQDLSDSTYYIAALDYDALGNESGLSTPLIAYPMAASAATGGSITPSGTFFLMQGVAQTFSITPGAACHVENVTVDGTSVGAVTSYLFSNITARHTIEAAFAINTYTITASAGANGSISPSVSVTYGAAHTFTITPRTGYHVATVTVDGTSVLPVPTSYPFSDVTANHTIEATFAIDTCTITASAVGNGSISPSVSVTYGAAHTFTITPAANYKISGVTVDGKPVGAVSRYTFTDVTANHTIAATFALIIYKISVTSVGGGSISPSKEVGVASGTNQAFTITPAANYKISGVTVDGKPVGAVSSYTFTDVTANHTIAATFALIIYKISASSDGGGSISPSGKVSVASGTNAKFIITPAPYYQLAELLVDGQSTVAVPIGNGKSSYTFTNVAVNHTIQAIFSRIPPPVADAGPDQDVTGGSTVTLNGSNSTDTVVGIASYRWTQTAGPPVKLISSPSVPGENTFTAPNISNGRLLSFTLVVTNNGGVTKSDSCLVNVSGSDDAPLANAGPGQTVPVPPYVNVTLDGSYGPDGKIASYRWTQIEGAKVKILNANTADPSFVPPAPGSLGVSLVFQLQVADGYGLTTRDWYTVSVVNADLPADLPPVADAVPNLTAVTGSSVTLDGSGSYDPRGSALTCRWKQIRGVPVTFLSDPAAAITVFTAPSTTGAVNPDLLFMLTVTDADDQLTASAECVVTVEPQ